MNCFKKLILILSCLVIGNNAFAFYSTKWVEILIPNIEITSISLDLLSINEHNNSLYYAVEYFKKNKEGKVVIVQSKGSKAGIVETYDSDEYEQIMRHEVSYPPKTLKVATTFKEITENSILYYPNQKAMEFAGYNGDIPLGNTDFSKYLKGVERIIKSRFPFGRYDRNEIIVLGLNIRKNGYLHNVDVKNSAETKAATSKILRDLHLIPNSAYANFTPLPQDYNGNSVNIQVTINCKNKLVNAVVTEQNAKESDEIYNLYMKDIKKRIYRNWDPPKKSISTKVVVLFKLSKTGELLSYEIKRSSGNELEDLSALSAIKKADFKPFPEGCKEETIDILFTFENSVFE